jgi:hypothetical protein
MSAVAALASVRQRPRAETDHIDRLAPWLAEESRQRRLPEHAVNYAALYQRERALLDVTGRALFNAYGRLAREYEPELWTTRSIYSRMIDRCWTHSLTPAQCALARFIYDRTLGWAKISEQITLRHFTMGTLTDEAICQLGGGRAGRPSIDDYQLDRHGIPIRAGLKMTKATAMKQLDWLVRDRAVHRIEWGTPGRLHYAYRLQLDWAGVLVALRCYAGASENAKKRFVSNVIFRNWIAPQDLTQLWPGYAAD